MIPQAPTKKVVVGIDWGVTGGPYIFSKWSQPPGQLRGAG
jgi:hypothetical protein